MVSGLRRGYAPTQEFRHNFNADRYLGKPNVPGAASLCLGNASLQIVDSDWYALVTELLMGKSLYP